MPCQGTEVPLCFKFDHEIDPCDYYVIQGQQALTQGQNAIWKMNVSDDPDDAHFEIKMELRLVAESVCSVLLGAADLLFGSEGGRGGRGAMSFRGSAGRMVFPVRGCCAIFPNL